MIVCQACGTENPSDRRYCSKCARKLDPETQRAVALKRAEHSAVGLNWSAIIAALVLFLVLFAVIFLVATHVF